MFPFLRSRSSLAAVLDPTPLRLSAAGFIAAALIAGCGNHGPAPVADAGPTGSAALPEPSASASSAPPATSEAAPLPEPPPPPPPSCPPGMLRVDGRFCVDKWEASLVDKRTKMPLSPYYPPDRKLAVRLAEIWETERFEHGGPKAQTTPLPPLPAWQREHDAEPMAQSRSGVKPNGYLSSILAERACKNAGKRLCRLDEWRTACQGDARRKYPYGDTYIQGACNVFRSSHPAVVLHDNASIGHFDPRLNLVVEENGDPLLRLTGATPRCRSAWGEEAAYDMNGNLDEWVEDEHGRFVGGFFSRSRRDGCEISVTNHERSYSDYSIGTRCCWTPGDSSDDAGAP